MTITQKYNLKMICNQAGDIVDSGFADQDEMACILKFEEVCLELQMLNKPQYTMIELGSNQAYYSCLFKGILGNDKTKNILLEPTPKYMERGKKHFEINKFDGAFEDGGIGHYWCSGDRWHSKELPSYTIDQLMNKHNLDTLDVLHSDIDGNEIRLIETSDTAFKQKRIQYVFLLTHSIWNEPESAYKSNIIKHGQSRHEVCKKYFADCGYTLLTEAFNVGYDGLLVYKA